MSAIIGEMNLVNGKVKMNGGVGYMSQTNWVQNLTLRENVVFGLPFDEAKYRRVLHDAALEQDIKTLPNGDLTEIGERGTKSLTNVPLPHI